MKIAAIDAGTNTLRILIAEAGGSVLKPLLRKRYITGLGREIPVDGNFGSKEMDLSLSAFKSFKTAMDEMGVTMYFAAGTQAFREARNRSDLIGTIREKTGIKISIIPAEQESEYTYEGIMSVLSPAQLKKSIIVDIGGGSTELMRGHPRKGRWCSTGLGVVYLDSIFSPRDPPSTWEIYNLRTFVKERLSIVKSCLGKGRVDRVVGTAGTYTTVAAIHRGIRKYDPSRINGVALNRDALEGITGTVIPLSSKKRLRIAGMEKGREILIVPGLIIAEEVMKLFSAVETVVSDGSLLEGVINALNNDTLKGEKNEPWRH